MTKNDYMQTLAQRLRRLPKEDYDKAIAYFEEYFEDAGSENEQQAISDLGTPDEAANALIMDLAVRNTQEPPKTVKKGLSAVWIGILGVCAAPIALPMAFAMLAVLFAVILCVLACIFALIVTAVALVGGGLVGLVGGIVFLFTSFSNGVATIGFALCSLGIGLAATYGSVLLCKSFLRKASSSLGKITKGGKKNDKKR